MPIDKSDIKPGLFMTGADCPVFYIKGIDSPVVYGQPLPKRQTPSLEQIGERLEQVRKRLEAIAGMVATAKRQ